MEQHINSYQSIINQLINQFIPLFVNQSTLSPHACRNPELLESLARCDICKYLQIFTDSFGHICRQIMYIADSLITFYQNYMKKWSYIPAFRDICMPISSPSYLWFMLGGGGATGCWNISLENWSGAWPGELRTAPWKLSDILKNNKSIN